MTYSQRMPNVDELGWGEGLRGNVGSVIDPDIGGINIAENVTHRNSKYWPNGDANHDEYKNFTVYVTETGTFHVWTISTDPSNTRYWRELQKTITSQGWVNGSGTISGYSNEIRGTGTNFKSMGLTKGSNLKVAGVNDKISIITVTEVISDTLMKGSFVFEKLVTNINYIDTGYTELTSIQITGVSNATITFSGGIATHGFKAGDVLYYWANTSTQRRLAIIQTISGNSVTVLWRNYSNLDTVATPPVYNSLDKFWGYVMATNKTYAYIQAIQSWNSPEKNLGNIDVNGVLDISELAVTNTYSKDNMPLYLRTYKEIDAWAQSIGFTLAHGGIGDLNVGIGGYTSPVHNVTKGDIIFSAVNSVLDPANKLIFITNGTAAFQVNTKASSALPDLHVRDGRIGINNTAPSEALHVVGNILATGTITPGSDKRWKEDITKIDSALEKISLLEGVTYHWKDKEVRGSDRQIGLIAQDVEKAFPEAVKKDNEGYMSVNYDGLVGALVEAIKEQQIMINELKSEVSELKSKLA